MFSSTGSHRWSYNFTLRCITCTSAIHRGHFDGIFFFFTSFTSEDHLSASHGHFIKCTTPGLERLNVRMSCSNTLANLPLKLRCCNVLINLSPLWRPPRTATGTQANPTGRHQDLRLEVFKMNLREIWSNLAAFQGFTCSGYQDKASLHTR